MGLVEDGIRFFEERVGVSGAGLEELEGMVVGDFRAFVFNRVVKNGLVGEGVRRYYLEMFDRLVGLHRMSEFSGVLDSFVVAEVMRIVGGRKGGAKRLFKMGLKYSSILNGREYDYVIGRDDYDNWGGGFCRD